MSKSCDSEPRLKATKTVDFPGLPPSPLPPHKYAKKESKKGLVGLMHKFCKIGKVRAAFQLNLDSVYYVHVEDVSSLMPKLPPGRDYYTQPSIEELEKYERAEPGFCTHVNDFVVGRRDYGSIKFLGETDISGLRIASLLQFKHLKLRVYLDHTKKPPVGQRFNKPAEVTLLGVNCVGTLTEFIDKLKRKAKEIEAEFMSYDKGKREWKFKVLHF